jgi:hypothetical protein
MLEEQPQQETSSISTVRMGLAIIFLALAIPLGIWVLTAVNNSINDAKAPAILQKIVPSDAASCDVNTPIGRFEIPKPAFNGMSYFILYLFLLIPTTITIALIKGSVSLLNPDLSRQFYRLVESIRKNVTPKQ